MSAIVCSKSSSTYARACFWESSYANNRAVLFRISAAASFHSLPGVNRLICGSGGALTSAMLPYHSSMRLGRSLGNGWFASNF